MLVQVVLSTHHYHTAASFPEPYAVVWAMYGLIMMLTMLGLALMDQTKIR